MEMSILQDPLQMSPHHIWKWPYCKIPYKCHHTLYADDHSARSLTNVTTPYMKMTILQDPLQMSPNHTWRWPHCKIPYKCHHTIYGDDHTARSFTNVTTPYMKMTTVLWWLFSLNYDNTHANENDFVELLRKKFIRFKSTKFIDYIVTKNKIVLIYKVLHSFYLR